MRKILVTSALPYANGSIHLGHLVEYIQTDIWVRAQRFSNNSVHYICADDTHGTPIMLRAEMEKISADELVKKVHEEHSNDFADFNIKFDNLKKLEEKKSFEESKTISSNFFRKGKKNEWENCSIAVCALDSKQKLIYPSTEFQLINSLNCEEFLEESIGKEKGVPV